MRRRYLIRPLLAGFGFVLGAASVTAADIEPAAFRRLRPAAPVAVPCPQCVAPAIPCPTCPPGTLIPAPTTPGMPATPGSPTAPTSPTDPNAPPTPAPDPSAQMPSVPEGSNLMVEAPARGTGSGGSLMPNLMGDLLGARSSVIGIQRNLVATIPTDPSQRNGNVVVAIPQSGGNITLSPAIAGQGNTTSLSLSQALGGAVSSFNQTLLPGQSALSPVDAAGVRLVLQAAFSGQQLTPQQIALLPPNIRAALPRIQGVANQIITQATNGVAVPNPIVGPVTGLLVGNNLEYRSTITGQQVVPLPGSSGVVGRIKLSEDNNPFPRDRFIFNYDVFDNVPFAQNGITVNRFQFGMEKTFLDGRASFEFRLPFAGTLNSTTVQGFEGTNTELGNLRLALKYLWRHGDVLSISSGIGVTLPTADDQIVLSSSVVPGVNPLLYKIQNETVQVEPFIAAAFTPTDRLFGQLWSSVNFDTAGSKITYNRDVFGGGTGLKTSTFIDVPLLSVDGQVGYWVIKNATGRVRGLAPFLEMHWNYAIAQDRLFDEIDKETRGEGLRVQSIADSELNLTAGATTQFGNNLFVTLGGTAPMLNRPNRTFDGQFGLRVNYYFGRTARQFANVVPNSY